MDEDAKILEIIENERKKTESAAKGSTEINLIESILNSAMKKLRLFLGLPFLLTDNGTPLKQLLGEHEFQKYKELCNFDYSNSIETIRDTSDDDLIFYTYNDSNLEVLFNGYNPDPNIETSEQDREFYNLLSKLYSNPKVSQVCDQLSDKLFLKNKFVINVLSRLKGMVIKNMKESPIEELEREQELSDMVQYIAWAKDELAVLSRKFNLSMNKQAQKIGEKCKEAGRTQDRTTAVTAHCKEMIEFLGRTSENKMIWERKKSEYVQENLFTEVKKKEAEFESIFSKHIVVEKNLRVKRYKTEAQLITILRKYDVDIKERDKSFKELLTMFTEEQRQLSEIKEQFEKQAIEYHALMDEKDEYERSIWEEKLYAIQMSVAARRIQRYYRGYAHLCNVSGYVRFKKKPKGKKKGK